MNVILQRLDALEDRQRVLHQYRTKVDMLEELRDEVRSLHDVVHSLARRIASLETSNNEVRLRIRLDEDNEMEATSECSWEHGSNQSFGRKSD